MRNIIVSVRSWFRRAPVNPSETREHSEVAFVLKKAAAADTRSYTEQGISAAIARAQSGEVIKVGAKVGHINGDTIGRLVSVDGNHGIVRFSDEHNAKSHSIKLSELFDVELAQILAHTFRDADLPSNH